MKWFYFRVFSFELFLEKLTNAKMLLPSYWWIKQNFIFDIVILIDYLSPSVVMVSSNPWVGPSPSIQISSFYS